MSEREWPSVAGRCTTATPIGQVLITAGADGVTGVYFEGRWPTGVSPADAHDERQLPVLRQARDEIDAYFAGTLRSFSVPLSPHGTPFQRAVWKALLAIPFGDVASYGAIAARLGNPKAVRAVGAANGQNPIPIIIPCHRVVGSDGSLTGFGGGMARKQWLLEHEGALPSLLQSPIPIPYSPFPAIPFSSQ